MEGGRRKEGPERVMWTKTPQRKGMREEVMWKKALGMNQARERKEMI